MDIKKTNDIQGPQRDTSNPSDLTNLTNLTDPSSIKDLQTVETELMSCMDSDKRTWIKMYRLMTLVETENLYKQDGLRSFTAWVNRMASRTGTHVSVLWSRLNAGRSYEAFERRARQSGKSVPSLDDLPGTVSPESLSLCRKVGGTDTTEVDQLMTKVLEGTLTREDLREASRAKRRSESASAAESIGTFGSTRTPGAVEQSADSTESTGLIGLTELTELTGLTDSAGSITAAEIVTALRRSDWLAGISSRPAERDGRGSRFVPPVYHVLTEVAAASGTTHHSRQIDAVVAENITCDHHSKKLILHGIEIKVSESDLRRDHKMAEYVPYVDLFWLAVPDTPTLLDAVEDVRLPEWGVLVVTDDLSGRSVRIVHNAVHRDGTSGVLREQTLEVIVLRARDFKRGVSL